MDSLIADGLLRYFATRRYERNELVDRAMAAMTDRERRLVREAAVMGYVQGVRSMPGGHKATMPGDGVILRLVIDACLVMDDLYPEIGGLIEPEVAA